MTGLSGDFKGTERFKLRRRLGAGGMGVVYEAYDQERERTVALKTLLYADASHVYRLKKEFRAMADVAHPNLVGLYELMSDGEYWFFTMELVDGVSFLEYVRPEERARRPDSNSKFPTWFSTFPTYDVETGESMDTLALPDGAPPPMVSVSEAHESMPGLNVERLRSALRQLAEGVHALHGAKMLHRDLKPTNVLVTDDDRVVILDFGLVMDTLAPDRKQSLALAGTPAYMSPEQMNQQKQKITEASDWYNVGVMLYEALTGRLPFEGELLEVLIKKQHHPPPAPSALAPGVPEDLSDLCLDLIRPKPEDRPTGEEVLRRLDAARAPGLTLTPAPTPAPAPREDFFVGRGRQVGALDDAFRATRAGQAVTVYIHGRSGMGKSALVRHFLEELLERERAGTVVLEGRCYERESVPYKAVDGVVDSLSKYLMSLPGHKAEPLMPRDIHALARLFPVLLQVKAVYDAPRREQTVPDPLALRRRAFAALRELLARITDRQALVIYIDDMQWADADSVVLLEDLLRPPDAPPLLLIASFRSEEVESKEFLKKLLRQAGGESCRELSVEPLPPEEAEELARLLLGEEGRPFVEAVVREAEGSPFFIEQLSRHALAGKGAGAGAGVTLSEMVEELLRRQPAGAREFLETLAVAGRPVTAEVAFEAAGLEGDEESLIATLRASHLLRSSGTNRNVELYHDRIRVTLVSMLDADAVRRVHARLADVLTSNGYDDAESLYEHYVGAGSLSFAATQATLAAEKAAAALAFDRAALFYRRALELSSFAPLDVIELHAKLGEALANAGRPAEAAHVYLDTAREAEPARALDLRRRAAAQLLMGGHIEEGLEVIRSVLAAVGLRLAAGPKRALLSLLIRRIQLRLRGYGFEERAESEVPESELLRLDTCWAVAVGLSLVDTIRAADFQTRHLMLALNAGEPYRIALAVAWEAAFAAGPGGPGRERAAELLRQAEALARKVEHPHAAGFSALVKGLTAYLVGNWPRAAEWCERAAEILRDQCTGVMWELSSANRFMLSSFLYLGELREVSRRVPMLLSAALDQGNLYAATDLRTRMNLVWLADDDPDGARREVIEALQSWPHGGFHLQHYSAMLALAQNELYTGDGLVAWKHVTSQWGALTKSLLLRVQVLRIEARHLRARCALLTARSGLGPVKQLVREAEKLAGKIEREQMEWGAPLALLVRAACARLRGEDARAMSLLSSAAGAFAAADMKLYAAAARRRLGQLTGGERGEQLIKEADEWMAGQNIKNPVRMTRMLAPGFRAEQDE